MKKNIILCVSAALSLGLSLVAARADDLDASKLPPASKQTGVTYDKDIKPLFDKSCAKCHGAERQRGKYRLDSLASTIKGGKSRNDVVPGKSDQSALVFAVAHIGDDDMKFMPPPQEKSHIAPLTKEQIGLIRA